MSARVIYNPVTTRRQQPQQELGGVDPEKSRVRRNLFGPVDHEESHRLAKEELVKMQNADISRWNFNFEKEIPLKGRYEWQVVTSEVPSAYELHRMHYLGQHSHTSLSCTTKEIVSPLSKVSLLESSKIEDIQSTPSGKTDRSRSDRESDPNNIASDAPQTENQEAGPSSRDIQGKATKQAKITDYMNQRKRASTTVVVSVAKRRHNT